MPVLALSQQEYESLAPEQRQAEIDRVRQAYADCGADYAIANMSELPALPALEENEQMEMDMPPETASETQLPPELTSDSGRTGTE